MRKTCIPCNAKTPQLTPLKISELLENVPSYELHEVDDMQRISKTYKFKNFKLALSFTKALGEICEEENHHPQIILEWGKVKVSWWTHSIAGLDTNDFIMALKSEKLFESSFA